MAEKDAKALYKAGEKRLGTDEKTFIRVFSERSAAHLAAVDSAYHNMYGNSLKKAIKKETSGHFEHALKTILQCSENPAKYFVKKNQSGPQRITGRLSSLLLKKFILSSIKNQKRLETIIVPTSKSSTFHYLKGDMNGCNLFCHGR
ncbi:hypothetical protein BDE02_15G093800 [Populus trichocarpa]|nr:hypothetical protein BDE02_15G093800 [Populus trichocarpa]